MNKVSPEAPSTTSPRYAAHSRYNTTNVQSASTAARSPVSKDNKDEFAPTKLDAQTTSLSNQAPDRFLTHGVSPRFHLGTSGANRTKAAGLEIGKSTTFSRESETASSASPLSSNDVYTIESVYTAGNDNNIETEMPVVARGWNKLNVINTGKWVDIGGYAEVTTINAGSAVKIRNKSRIFNDLFAHEIEIYDEALANNVHSRNNVQLSQKAFANKIEVKNKLILRDSSKAEEVISGSGDVELYHNSEINRLSSDSNIDLKGEGRIGSIETEGEIVTIVGPVKISEKIMFKNKDGKVILKPDKSGDTASIDSEIIKNGSFEVSEKTRHIDSENTSSATSTSKAPVIMENQTTKAVILSEENIPHDICIVDGNENAGDIETEQSVLLKGVSIANTINTEKSVYLKGDSEVMEIDAKNSVEIRDKAQVLGRITARNAKIYDQTCVSELHCKGNAKLSGYSFVEKIIVGNHLACHHKSRTNEVISKSGEVELHDKSGIVKLFSEKDINLKGEGTIEWIEASGKTVTITGPIEITKRIMFNQLGGKVILNPDKKGNGAVFDPKKIINGSLINNNPASKSKNTILNNKDWMDTINSAKTVSLKGKSGANIINTGQDAGIAGNANVNTINAQGDVYIQGNGKADIVNADGNTYIVDNAIANTVNGKMNVYMKGNAIVNIIDAEKKVRIAGESRVEDRITARDVDLNGMASAHRICCKNNISLREESSARKVIAGSGKVQVFDNSRIDKLFSKTNINLAGRGTVGNVETEGEAVIITGPVKINGKIMFRNPGGKVILAPDEKNNIAQINSEIILNGSLISNANTQNIPTRSLPPFGDFYMICDDEEHDIIDTEKPVIMQDRARANILNSKRNVSVKDNASVNILNSQGNMNMRDSASAHTVNAQGEVLLENNARIETVDVLKKATIKGTARATKIEAHEKAYILGEGSIGTAKAHGIFFMSDDSKAELVEAMKESNIKDNARVNTLNAEKTVNLYGNAWAGRINTRDKIWLHEEATAEVIDAMKEVIIKGSARVGTIKTLEIAYLRDKASVDLLNTGKEADLEGNAHADTINSQEGASLKHDSSANIVNAKKNVYIKNRASANTVTTRENIYMKESAKTKKLNAKKNAYLCSNTHADEIKACGVYMRNNATVKSIEAEEAKIGDNCEVENKVIADNLVLRDRAKVRKVISKSGNISLLNNSKIDELFSKKNIKLSGEGTVGNIKAGGNTVTITGNLRISEKIIFEKSGGKVVFKGGLARINPELIINGSLEDSDNRSAGKRKYMDSHSQNREHRKRRRDGNLWIA